MLDTDILSWSNIDFNNCRKDDHDNTNVKEERWYGSVKGILQSSETPIVICEIFLSISTLHVEVNNENTEETYHQSKDVEEESRNQCNFNFNVSLVDFVNFNREEPSH